MTIADGFYFGVGMIGAGALFVLTVTIIFFVIWIIVTINDYK